ncbi:MULTISPECIES: hypothetical protein [unclassified Streptomyces]|uniref:hypothetical protein n=1 Tax=unclassified Streptomyces TaxID=2593676 RepID=UPI00381F517D
MGDLLTSADPAADRPAFAGCHLLVRGGGRGVWLPPAPDALCRYGAEATATQVRWGLAVDEAERDRLLDIAAGCGGTEVEFTPAP